MNRLIAALCVLIPAAAPAACAQTPVPTAPGPADGAGPPPAPEPAGTPAPSPAEEPAPPAFTCALEARFDRLDDAQYVPAKAAVTLPDGALLRLGVYYLKPASEIFHRPGRPVPPPDEILLDETTVEVKDGRAEARLWITKRLPYPGAYRVRAAIYWTEQPDFFKGPNPEEREPLEWTAELTRGAPRDIEAEREAVRRDVKADVDRVVALQRALASKFRETLRQPPAPEAWDAWLASWREPLGPLKARNAERPTWGVIWNETQGRYRIEDLSGRVEELAAACTAALRSTPPPADVPAEILQMEKDFDAIYDGALNLLGYLRPVDPALVREHLGPMAADIERLAAAAKALREDPPGMTPDAVEALRREALDRLHAGFSALLPVGPEQAVEPATAYTEAVTAFFDASAAAARGDRKAADALEERIDDARKPFQRLNAMLGAE